jgi:hypothetical protein
MTARNLQPDDQGKELSLCTPCSVQQLYLFTLVVINATQLRFQIWKNLLVLHHVGDVCNRELGWDYVNLCFSASAMI